MIIYLQDMPIGKKGNNFKYNIVSYNKFEYSVFKLTIFFLYSLHINRTGLYMYDSLGNLATDHLKASK